MRLVRLNTGEDIQVDDVDFDFVSALGHKRLDRYGYAIARIHGKCVLIHREIAARAGLAVQSMLIDHRNTNKLDNQRHNLRLATHLQNRLHRGPHKSNLTGFKGVKLTKGGNYESRIIVLGRFNYLGTFESSTEAAKAYNTAALKYFDHEFVWLNRIADRRTTTMPVANDRRLCERRGRSNPVGSI